MSRAITAKGMDKMIRTKLDTDISKALFISSPEFYIQNLFGLEEVVASTCQLAAPN